MRAQKVNPENVDQMLFNVFSEFGYDGASMDLLSRGTGLKKASLYHRFPKGKKEMALHVLKIVEDWIQENIVSISKDRDVKRELKLKKVIIAIDQLYNGGVNNCLLRTLTIGTDADAFKESVTNCFNLLTEGFTAIAIDFGSSSEIAEEKAKNVNRLIQGALVIAGATNDKSFFKNSLNEIPALLKA
jgi:AcrR family transcriptional regulator